VKDFLDESGLEELLQLHSSHPTPFFVEALQPLLHGSGAR
jgi:hypothetical protein